MREGVRTAALIIGPIIGGLAFVLIADVVNEKRAREGPARQVDLDCFFPDEGTLALREESGLPGGARSSAMYRYRVEWLDVKTGQKLARVQLGKDGRMNGCDTRAVWLTTEEGALEAWSPKGTLLAREPQLLEAAKLKGAVLPLLTKQTRMHRRGGLMVHSNDARLWRATADPVAFEELGSKDALWWDSIVWEPHGSPRFGGVELKGSPRAVFKRGETELEQLGGFIKPTAFSEVPIVFAHQTMDEQSAIDATRVDVDAAKVVWKRTLGPGRVKQGVVARELLILLIEPHSDDARYGVVALDLNTGQPAWSYAP